MSTIAVNAITDANGGSTTSINGTTPNAYNTVGKNLIINGAMQIAQRGTSDTGNSVGGYVTVDRFRTNMSSAGTWTIEQSTDAPDGFSNSWKHSCTTATASPSYIYCQQRIEGQNVQHLAKGTSSAKSVTASFWVKCNKTGDMQVNLRDLDNGRIIANTVTINSADTWEKKSLTFVGDTTGTLVNDVNESLRLEWWLDSGSAYSSGSVPTTWQSENTVNRNAGGTLALSDSTSNYISITGVQLEVGESATEFEHRPYTTEELLCFRYFCKNNSIYYSALYTNAGAIVSVDLPVKMRSTPTQSYTSESGSGSISDFPRQRRLHFYDTADITFSVTDPTASAEL